MEDAHTTILNLDGSPRKDRCSFFAVFDGHSGQAYVFIFFVLADTFKKKKKKKKYK